MATLIAPDAPAKQKPRERKRQRQLWRKLHEEELTLRFGAISRKRCRLMRSHHNSAVRQYLTLREDCVNSTLRNTGESTSAEMGGFGKFVRIRMRLTISDRQAGAGRGSRPDAERYPELSFRRALTLISQGETGRHRRRHSRSSLRC
jgi:hypothetical protein